MKKTARTYAARRDRNRALAKRRQRAATDAAAHRSACCLRRAPPAARATSDTRTSESHGAPGNATPHRRRSLRTTALAEKEYASFSMTFDWRQRSVGAHFITMSAPPYLADEKACDIDAEREQIARRTEPPPVRSDTQSMINSTL